MRLHGRHDIRKIGEYRRIILLNEQVYRVATGGYYNIPVALSHHALIFLFDDSCADRSLLGVIEAELLKRLTH